MKIKKIIDLTQTMYHNNPGYFPYELVEFKLEKIHARDGYTSERVAFNTHTATHFDAPKHHFPDGMGIDEMPVEWFVGSAVPVDAFDIEPHGQIGLEILEKYDDIVKEDDIILLCTGYAYKRDWTKDYCDNWPYLSNEGSDWMVDKGVKGVAIDVMSIGGPRDGEAKYQHELFLSNNIWIGEELFLPRELLEHERWTFIALPLKLQGCSGAPGRAIAILEED